jgi:hypothetical protein
MFNKVLYTSSIVEAGDSAITSLIICTELILITMIFRLNACNNTASFYRRRM